MLHRIKALVPRPLVNLVHFARAAAAVARYGAPARKLFVIGITGTDGKTTTSHLVYSILRAAGLPVSLISTTGAIIFGRTNEPLGFHVTTPNPFELQAYLKKAYAAGSRYIVLESTSHGLDQYRVWGSNFRIGVVTNVTHEHLDYHKTWEAYLKSKARLLQFPSIEISILNRDDAPSFEQLKNLARGRVISYGIRAGAEISPTEVEYSPEGTTCFLPALGRPVRTRLLGDYNLQNTLAAAAVGLALDLPPEAIARGLETAAAPPGRLEKVDLGQPFTVYVDFAHTPNALENVLKLLRSITPRESGRRLIAVFGCAGLRDPGKRVPMGASAGRYCDFTVITAEDPRTENLERIMDEIASGCETEGGIRGETFICIPDRAEAIRYAIQEAARPGDVVVTAGKAHEQSMCFGTTEYPWDEFAAVRAALQGRDFLPGLKN